MKYVAFSIIVLLGVFVLALGFTRGDTSGDNLNLTIRVTSSDPNEKLAFKMSYIFGGADGELKSRSFRTPYTITRSAIKGYISGIFQKLEGKSYLIVELLSDNDNKSALVSATGSVIVLYTDISRMPVSYAIQEFSK